MLTIIIPFQISTHPRDIASHPRDNSKSELIIFGSVHGIKRRPSQQITELYETLTSRDKAANNLTCIFWYELCEPRFKDNFYTFN